MIQRFLVLKNDFRRSDFLLFLWWKIIACPFLISSNICTFNWMPNPNSNTKWILISMLTLSNGFLVVGILLSKGGNDVISYRNHGTSHNLFKFSFISLSSNPYYFLFRFLGFLSFLFYVRKYSTASKLSLQ